MNNVIFFVLTFFNISYLSAQSKIRLYSFYTKSHRVFKDQWFLPSLQDDYEVIIKYYPQECPSALHWSKGWQQVMLRKIELILNAIDQNWGNIFIYADIDIQFFAKTKEHILSAIADKDLVFQRDNPSGVLCAGFFACRANSKTKKLFTKVKDYMIKNKEKSDQRTINILLRKKKLVNIAWDYLPVTFFGGGILTGSLWSPGKKLRIPTTIVMHHANWTRGVKHKIAQLQYVKNVVENQIQK